MNSKSRIIISLLLASTLVDAQNIHIDSIGVNLGLAGMPTKQVDKRGTLTLDRAPKALYLHGELYTLIGGVFENTKYKPTINVIFNTNSDFNNYLFLTGVNRYFEYEKHNLYLGLLAGTGIQSWSYNPLHKTQIQKYNADSLVGAVQAGAEYHLSSSLHLGINMKYYLHHYSAILDPTSTTSTEINHNHSYSVSVGLRYSFGENAVESSPPEETSDVVVEDTPVIEKAEPMVETQKEVASQSVAAASIAVVDPDKDKDGVLNENDICPNTPLHKTVDEEGCQRLQSYTIAFAPNYVKLDERYMETLKSYALFLREHPSYSAKIIGYSDSIGSKRSNQLLSQGRADIVATYFMAKGVDPKQLSYEGKGETNPIGDNATKEGRAKNRRVEITYTRESKK